jgi:hypothetical protein
MSDVGGKLWAMGSSSWSYVAPYAGDVASSLRALQGQLIRDRDYYWYWDAGYAEVEFRPRPETVEELWDSEDFWASGSSTILDIRRVVDTAEPPGWRDHATIRPLPLERIQRYFGSEKPARAQFESLASDRGNLHHNSFWCEGRARWNGYYVLLYEAGTPAEIGFWGDSGD